MDPAPTGRGMRLVDLMDEMIGGEGEAHLPVAHSEEQLPFTAAKVPGAALADALSRHGASPDEKCRHPDQFLAGPYELPVITFSNSRT